MPTENKLTLDNLFKSYGLNQLNENVISVTLFGSYNTEFWIEGKSDIDILLLLKYSDFNVEYEVEEYYRPLLVRYFKHEDIHFTFVSLKDFDSVFADIYIDYEDKVIFDMDLHYDFLMYISKYNRVNERLINLVRRDWEEKYGVL
ncbi:nucleotidyltransferase domain-containing protein [Clostridium sp.]|uniref:nucleotidyltransferase domain-containing protein n=1 Tax=Clostridium sp. TaxID=1506 RepID=UPI003217FEC7